MLAFAAKEQYSSFPEPSLRLSVISQTSSLVLSAGKSRRQCAQTHIGNAEEPQQSEPLPTLITIVHRRRVVLAAVCQNAVNQAVFHGFFRGHKAIALGVAFDLLQRLAGMLGHQFVHARFHLKDFTRVDFDVRRLAW